MIKLLSQNIMIFGLSNILKSLVPLLLLPILTTHLSLHDFGVLSIIETTILFLTPFILLNINAGINVEYFNLKHSDLKQYISNALLLSSVAFMTIFILLFMFQHTIATLFHINQTLVIFLSVFSLLRVFPSVTLGLLQVSHQAKYFAYFSLVQTLLDLLLSYLFVVFYHYGYIGRLSGIYIAFFIMSLYAIYYLYKSDYLGTINWHFSKDILKFTIPLIPHAVGGTIIAMSDRYFISYFVDNAHVGLYTIAYQLSAVLLLVSMSVNQAWSPFLFKLLKAKEIKKIYLISFVLFIFFIVCAIVIYLLKDVLFYILVDEKFYMAKEYFFYLLVGFLFQSFYFLVTNFLFYQKKSIFLASLTISGAVLNVILNYYFIQTYGTIGVAYATAITWALFFIVVLLSNVKFLRGLSKTL